MAQLDFFALKPDILDILNAIFDQSDLRVFEAYSKFNCELREFQSVEALVNSDHFEVNHGAAFLRCWSPTVTPQVEIRKFKIKADIDTVRYCMEGAADIQIIQGRPDDSLQNALRPSIFSHWNEAGAKQRSNAPDTQLMDIDWKALRRISGRIQRHIKNKTATGRLYNNYILPNSHQAMREGMAVFAQGIHTIDSPDIITL